MTRRYLAALVLAGVATFAASQAFAGDPSPTNVNGQQNPAVGAVVARLAVNEDGTCDLGADGLTLTAAPDAGETGSVAVEVGEGCVVRVVAAADPGPAPDGRTVTATP